MALLGEGKRRGQGVERRTDLRHLIGAAHLHLHVAPALGEGVRRLRGPAQWAGQPQRHSQPGKHGDDDADHQREQYPAQGLIGLGQGVGAALHQHDATEPGAPGFDEHPLAVDRLLARKPAGGE